LDTRYIINDECPDIKIELLPQESFAEPHIYDAVYPLLDRALADIKLDAPDAELIVNVSSQNT
jgi:hypothetical protein